MWRLSCYPNGCTKSSEGYMSVFLQLCTLPPLINKLKVKYKIKLEEMSDDLSILIMERRSQLVESSILELPDGKKSFFKGSFWLIEATYNSQAIFFKNAENIIPGKEINICFKN